MSAALDLDFIISRLDKRTKRRLLAKAWAIVENRDLERDRRQAEEEAKAAAANDDATPAEASAAERERKWRERELARCAADPIYWFNTYLWTYNPKLQGRKNDDGTKVSPFVRFKLWPKQEEFLGWLDARVKGEEQGAVKKSRDVGVSYLCCGFALHHWLFEDGFKATFGSRVKDYVDKKGNPDALFPKLRIMLYRLPEWMLPEGFVPAKHDVAFQLTNPAREAVITGEGGENMGRGGRSTFYVLDEAAHVDNAEDIEAALTGNTDCVIWVSSANGIGNLFYRKCHGGLPPGSIFTLHYRDDPRKTPEWVAKKKSETSAVKWAQEYEIDFSASLEGVCIKGKWVKACQELARMVSVEPPAETTAGLDVGAGGKGKSIFIARAGALVFRPLARREADTTGTALWGYDNAVRHRSRHLNYDAPGVGAGVTSTYKHVKRKGQDGRPILVHPINTGSDPFVVTGRWDDGRTSKEQFFNLRMEIWWIGRTRAEKSYQTWLAMTGAEEDDEGTTPRLWPIEECLLLPSGDPESEFLADQLASIKVVQRPDGRMIMESKKDLAKRGVASPDDADALMLTFVERRMAYDPAALAGGAGALSALSEMA